MSTRWKFLLAATISSVAYLFLIASGWSRGLESKLYDLYLQFCPRKSQDEKIVIVGLTEDDITNIGHFPINDRILGNLLLKIRDQNPRVIGLDLHRNVKTGDSDLASEKLALIFRDTPNLIGVEKTTGGNPLEQPILPHPELVGKTGDSVIIEDEDKIVRRGYLYPQSSESQSTPSFGLAVALKYLQQENIEPTNHQSWLKLNNTVFPQLRKNLPFYSADAIDNYQILIDYCSAQKRFKHFNFSQVLSEDFPGEVFKEKIVLLGSRAETIGDIYKIPNQSKIIRGSSHLIFGFEIHGYLVSSLVNSALTQNRVTQNTLGFLPISVEYIFLSFFLLVDALWFVLWLNRKPRTFIGLLFLLTVQASLILVLGFIAFLCGWWIPIISYIYIASAIALVCSFFIYVDKLKEENLLLEKKITEKTQKLAEAYKQLEAQEKLFAHQVLAKTFSHEIKNKTSSLRVNTQNCQANIAEINQILDNIDECYFSLEDLGEGLVDPRQLCSKGLEQLNRIEDLVHQVTLILEELNKNSGRESLQVSSIDINELLQVIVSEVTQAKPLENLRIDDNYDNSLTHIIGIKQHLERAFENIILNACDSLVLKSKELEDYIPVITIVTKDIDDLIEIKIRDNGQGIALDEQDKIFDMEWTTKSELGGKGLGLYFAKNLILEHGGDIQIESQLGEYAEFVIKLPNG